uniref:Uncharacterized protein n=1 Tax=Physcomitrium patens TaxID=3218 RepID=A0A2K1KP15_PHYPA|nr:hypothetical protein PHYPA_006403 [Physcomitrium patens]
MSKNNVNKYDMVANDSLSSDEIFLNIWVGIKIQEQMLSTTSRLCDPKWGVQGLGSQFNPKTKYAAWQQSICTEERRNIRIHHLQHGNNPTLQRVEGADLKLSKNINHQLKPSTEAKHRIQTSAPHQDSSKVVDATPSMPSDVVKQDKLKVLSMLFNSVKDNVIYHIALKMDPADCCHTFYELYESKNMAQTMYLFDQLQSLRLEELQSMTDYIRCTRELTSQLQDIGETLSKDRIVHTMLNGLPSNYKAFI